MLLFYPDNQKACAKKNGRAICSPNWESQIDTKKNHFWTLLKMKAMRIKYYSRKERKHENKHENNCLYRKALELSRAESSKEAEKKLFNWSYKFGWSRWAFQLKLSVPYVVNDKPGTMKALYYVSSEGIRNYVVLVVANNMIINNFFGRPDQLTHNIDINARNLKYIVAWAEFDYRVYSLTSFIMILIAI